MSKNPFDEKLESHFLDKTNKATHLKQETWDKINRELFSGKLVKKKKNKRKAVITILSAAAIFAFILFGLQTNMGQAMIQNLKDMFVENKKVELEIEGTTEERDVHLEANEELRYIIYVDEEYYKLIKEDEVDRIVPKQDLPDKYPEVSMEISQKSETTTEETMANIKQELLDAGMVIREEGKTSTPLEATMIRAIGDEVSEWDTPIKRYYVTDDIDGQLFIIKQVYFLEAAEGHGTRLNNMLESFEVIK